MKKKLFTTQRKTNKRLEAEIFELNNRLHEKEDQKERIRLERDKAIQDQKKTREQFEDLKQRILNLETENARLNGYLARVHEDDIVRDGLVEIEDGQGRRQVPKRPPPMKFNSVEIYDQFQSDNYMNYGSEKKTHWTSY